MSKVVGGPPKGPGGFGRPTQKFGRVRNYHPVVLEAHSEFRERSGGPPEVRMGSGCSPEVREGSVATRKGRGAVINIQRSGRGWEAHP